MAREPSAKETKVKRKPRGKPFEKGNVPPGRPKGALNKTTTALKQAILDAAGLVGEDGAGKAGLTGYLVNLAKTNSAAFASLLGKVLPLTLEGNKDNPLSFTRIECVIVDPPDSNS